MNDRTQPQRRANPPPARRANRVTSARGFATAVAVSAVAGALLYVGMALHPGFSNLLLDFRAHPLRILQDFPVSSRRAGSLMFPEAPGRLAVLRAADYARLLAAPDVRPELLYRSVRTGQYIVYLPIDANRAAVHSAVGEADLYPNVVARLQSLPRLSPSASRDPREIMQWFHTDWQHEAVGRFPLGLDQRFPSLKLQRTDEHRYWIRDLGAVFPFAGETCLGHDPLTSRTSFAQDWLVQRKTNLVDGFIIVHDSTPDAHHPDLRGLVSNLTQPALTLTPGDHGTHSAGLIGALRNQIGVAGVAPGVPMRFIELQSGERGLITFREVIPQLATLLKFLNTMERKESGETLTQVILLSYAAEVKEERDGEPLRLIVEDLLVEHNVFVVVPAGNRSLPKAVAPSRFFPADWASTMLDSGRETGGKGVLFPVGATDVCSQPAWFTNKAYQSNGRAYYVPGQSIYSTLPYDDYGFLTGTSAAAAVTAGLAYMLVQHARELSPDEVGRWLRLAARPLGRDSADYILDAGGVVERLSMTDYAKHVRLPASEDAYSPKATEYKN